MNSNHKYSQRLIKDLQKELIQSCENNLKIHKKVGELRQNLEDLNKEGIDQMDKEIAEIEIQLFQNRYNHNASIVKGSLIALNMIDVNQIKWN